MDTTRTERDTMGKLQVPVDALWGAQTQRAVNNFPISGIPVPAALICSLGLIKSSAATVNRNLGLLESDVAEAIIAASAKVSAGEMDAHFPVDIFQTGSGTSSNMNANEVIARLAARQGVDVHPNDHVNMGQSSNDVIPSAIQVGACLETSKSLLPALRHLQDVLDTKAEELKDTVKTGRTHLMDAMPVTFGQELACWSQQVKSNIDRIESALERMRQLPQGGSAVGTGINAHTEFGPRMAEDLTRATGFRFVSAANYFEGISSQDTSVELSGQLKTLACSLMKISNDLRLMNSGPLAGFGDITLPELQPGSSIMPGKVNPVMAEAVCMVCAQVIGNDSAITLGGQAGNLQLNVMLPMIAHNLFQSITLLANSSRLLADSAIRGFMVNHDSINRSLERNPVLVTALNPVIGYELGAATAKQAYKEGRSIRDVARETTGLSDEELERLLDPLELTRGGIRG